MRAFVVTASHQPVAFIVEASLANAKIIVGSDVFRDMLLPRELHGKPLWDGKAELVVRVATPAEATEAHLGMARMRCSDPEAPEGAGATMLLGSC